jgi:hypothetical protein
MRFSWVLCSEGHFSWVLEFIRLNYYEESAKSGALSKKEGKEVKMPVIIPPVSVRRGKEMC